MARLLVRFNLGPGISPGQFAAIAADFSAMTDVALRWEQLNARSEAERFVAGLDYREIEQDRFHVSEDDHAALRAFREAMSIWNEFGQMPPDLWFERIWRYYYQPGKSQRVPIAALWGISPFSGPPTLEALAPDTFRRLVNQEYRRRAPTVVELEAVTYRNPLEFTLQDGLAVGGLLLGTGSIPRLLEILQAYTPTGRRERSARADEAEATARIRAAEATEAELRVKLLESLVAAGDGGPRDDALLEAIGDDGKILRLLARVGELNPIVEQLPSDGA